MEGKRILLITGGTWHNFNGFAEVVDSVFDSVGCTVDVTRDLNALKRLPESGHDAVLIYTCLTENNEDGSPATNRLTDEQARPLADWVAAGGALLGVHGATVSSQSSSVLEKLLGGLFLAHPPAFTFGGATVFPFPFMVHPMFGKHPITEGIDAFSVHDELYIDRCGPDVTVHMVGIDRGTAHPMVWSRTEGKGRVARIALGHDERVWGLPAYQRLMVQALAWTLG